MKNKHPVLRRFMRRKVSVVAAAVLILFVLIAILGPLVWQVDPLKQSVMKKYGPMTVQHPLGTDNLGRDTLARMIYGARVSLAISFAGVLSGALIGVLLGVSAGYFGGWVDAIISRFIDILLAFPGLLLAITIVAVLGPGSVNTVIAITIFTIPGLTRMVRTHAPDDHRRHEGSSFRNLGRNPVLLLQRLLPHPDDGSLPSGGCLHEPPDRLQRFPDHEFLEREAREVIPTAEAAVFSVRLPFRD